MHEGDPRDITRDLRRNVFVAEAIELVLQEILDVLPLEGPERDRALRGVLHRHLSIAWNDGAAREADLRSALDVLRTQVDLLKRNNRVLLKRISDSR